jgi:hypothetical protein
MNSRTRHQIAKSREQALAAFVAKKAEIDAMLTRLQALSDDHFGYAPDEITWSHAEGLAHYAELLKRVTGSACCHGATRAPRHASPFKEGDHAE